MLFFEVIKNIFSATPENQNELTRAVATLVAEKKSSSREVAILKSLVSVLERQNSSLWTQVTEKEKRLGEANTEIALVKQQYSQDKELTRSQVNSHQSHITSLLTELTEKEKTLGEANTQIALMKQHQAQDMETTRKRKIEGEATPGASDKKAKKEPEAGDSNNEAFFTSRQQEAVAQALAAGVPGGQQRYVSCVADTNTQRVVLVECFAPNDDHRWVNIGKERDGMAPNAVQYTRALRPPYHLLSFLRIKSRSTKGMSWSDKNTMVFVVLEGEITVILHTTQFNVEKGDSFYIPPKNHYNLINQMALDSELSLMQFQTSN